MKPNEFKCARCGGVFEKDWSEEEARAEQHKNFPGQRDDEMDMVCDDCYREFMGWAEKKGLIGVSKEEGMQRLNNAST